ncbi:hypothetical protein ACFPRH_11540, partial [Streptomyces amakusaensis]
MRQRSVLLVLSVSALLGLSACVSVPAEPTGRPGAPGPAQDGGRSALPAGGRHPAEPTGREQLTSPSHKPAPRPAKRPDDSAHHPSRPDRPLHTAPTPRTPQLP